MYLIFVYVFTHVCNICMCIQVWMHLYMYVPKDQTSTLGIFLYHLPLFFLIKGLLLNLDVVRFC